MTGRTATRITEGREALRSGDIAAARAIFEDVLAGAETAEALDGLGEAAYLDTDYKGAAELYERAYTAYRKSGDVSSAARCARMLAWINGGVFGDWAVEKGWYARARTILEDADAQGPDRAWVLIIRSYTEDDLAVREKLLREATEIGRRADDPVQFEALSYLGAVRIFTDRVDEGIAMFDEALAGVCGGDVEDVGVVDGMFCGFFWACELLHDVTRAEQWVRAAEEYMKRRNVVAAFCRAHYGGILTAAGRWVEAEKELTDSLRHFQHGLHGRRASGLIRLADLRVRQGRLEEAAQLLDGLDQHPDAVAPLAALHLARGETALAKHVLEGALADPEVERMRPGGPAAGPLLALRVEVALAEGALEDAAGAAERLQRLASEQRGDYLKAAAALAKGRVCVATGVEDAGVCFDEALKGFSKAQLPLELAQARLDFARALTNDSPEVAIAEAKEALRAFERLDASRYADATAALLRELGAPVRTGAKGGGGALTKREAEVLDLLGLGLSNPEISDRLFISRKTVEHHVGSILSKLQLRSRSEAAAYAARTGERPASE